MNNNNITLSYDLLTKGDYVKNGNDLIISHGPLEEIVTDYFTNPFDLKSPQGSTIAKNIVNILAVDTDSNLLAFEDPQAIGKITISDSAVVVQRGDKFIELQKGDFIYLNDVVDAANGAVGIGFKDQSTISVDPGAKMVIDDFVYDPDDPSTGSMNANILTGNFSFVSGQIAKTGNDAMQVTTPVLTIGVRGTQVAGKANQDGEENEIVLLPNEDGTVGQVMITNQSGSVLLTEAFQATTIATALQPPTVPVILPKEIVLKKFAKTIATTKKTEKVRKTEAETEEAAKEKAEAESEKEQLEEEAEELEEEAEQLEEEKEQLEEEAEQLEEEKEQLEEKAEELKEEIAELEEKLENADADEIEEIQEELAEAEQEIEEVEEQVEEVLEDEKVIEQKVEQVEEKVEEVQQEVQQIEQKVEVVDDKIKVVEQKFEEIVEDFEQFQQEFVEEFEEFIPEEELQQFVEEAPQQIIEEFQENIIEKLEEEKINVQENENEVAKDEDPFAEENVEKVLDELDEKQEELMEKADDLIEKDMQLQEEAKQLEEEAKALEEEALQLEKEAEEAYRNNDQEAIEEIEEQFQQLDEERQQIDENFQEIDEQYQEIDEDFEQLNEEFVAIDEEFQEVFQTNENMPIRIPEDGPMYNEDNDVFDVPIDEQVEVNVEEFIQEQKQNVTDNNQFAQEAEDFFENEEIQEMDIDQNVQDMFIINTSQIDEFITGNTVDSADDYYAQEDEMDDYFNVVDNNEELYNTQLEADDWFDQFIENLAQDQNINVAPWLDMPNDTSVSESLSVGTTLGNVYGSDANGDQLTYSILSDPSGKIAIDGNRLYLNSAFDNVSADTNYSVLLKVTDPYGASDTDEWIVTVTADQVLSTQYTKGVNYGGIATWGAKFSEDTVQDNWWANKKALIIGNSDIVQGGSEGLRTRLKNNLEDAGYTVTVETNAANITEWSDVNQYEQIWDVYWMSHTKSTAQKNAYEDYLQAGGSLYLGGELNSGEYSPSSYNQVNDSVEDMIQQVGGNFSYRSNSTVSSNTTFNSDYLVGPITASNNPAMQEPWGTPITTTDGSYIKANQVAAEWGPDVLNTNIQGTVMANMDFNYLVHSYPNNENPAGGNQWAKTYINWLAQEAELNSSIVTYDTEHIPLFADSYGSGAHTAQNDITEVEAFHLGDNVYIGGGMSHTDWAWDDSADAAYWAFNTDMDDGATPTQADDHYGVIGYDRDGDGDLWEATDTFNLDKIYIKDDSVDYMAQDADATSSYYFKVTPVKYSNGSWTFDTGHTVTVSSTTNYNQYLDLSSNTDFDDINYAIIETESALISEVVVTA